MKNDNTITINDIVYTTVHINVGAKTHEALGLYDEFYELITLRCDVMGDNLLIEHEGTGRVAWV